MIVLRWAVLLLLTPLAFAMTVLIVWLIWIVCLFDGQRPGWGWDWWLDAWTDYTWPSLRRHTGLELKARCGEEPKK